MFVRAKKKAEDRYSIQIVQNTRDGKKVKQKILRHVGVARSDDEVNKLKEIAEEFMANIIVAEKENNRQKQLFPLTHKDALLHVRSKKGRKPIKKIEDILPVDKVTLADIVSDLPHENECKIRCSVYGAWVTGDFSIKRCTQGTLKRFLT